LLIEFEQELTLKADVFEANQGFDVGFHLNYGS